ncbi:Fatty acyl-CoA reductase [Melia azedarach]|uniref:Fatty acyl-CoA reductase n=1 Tax=Melia azedarach TaxID=155640 RepID=A0ACC1YP39_MELAZ|nr:Fatty acyl-CoA reductase [Melia azedarach]
MVEKELFRVISDTWNDKLESFISEKVTAVPGDVSYENLGIKNYNLKEEMLKAIDLVVNFAATTAFYARYDVAFDTNTMGIFHVLNFAKRCNKIKMLVHVSTAYVCGERSGLILEDLFSNGETLSWEICKLDIFSENKLIKEKLNELQAENASDTNITSTMKELGKERAMLYGWPNTYVFTKAMGEMLLNYYKDNISIIIIRPTMIPADMVVNLMMMAMIANDDDDDKSSQVIYHVCSSMRNPLRISNLREFMSLYFTNTPYVDKNGKEIKVSKVTLLDSSARFDRYIAIRYQLPLKGLKLINSIFCQCFKNVCLDLDRKIKVVMQLVELYEPYMFFNGIFDDTNSRKLHQKMIDNEMEANEIDAFNFDPRCIDWEDYIINTHIPGLLRHVLKK